MQFTELVKITFRWDTEGQRLATFGGWGRYFRDLLAATIFDVAFEGALSSGGRGGRGWEAVLSELYTPVSPRFTIPPLHIPPQFSLMTVTCGSTWVLVGNF